MIKNIQKLIVWYTENRRQLPWRTDTNPYKIWLSEIILQQTRINQGTAYYEAFLRNYPDVKKLAAASESEVLKLWQGLGYYTRARNLHKAAKVIAHEHNGIFPSTYKEIIKLPGVGSYTAAAISSIAFNEPVAAIDGNVKRVISRVYALKTRIDKPETVKQISKNAQNMIDNVSVPGDFNQAMMELGAVICKPRSPMCDSCPLISSCEAMRLGIQEELPVKKPKVKTRKRYFYYYVFLSGNYTILIKRKGKDIWKGLYEFPLIETDKPINNEKILTQAQQTWGIDIDELNGLKISPVYRHVLTHQIIEANFVIIHLSSLHHLKGDILPVEAINNYPVSRLTEKYLNNEKKIL